MLSRILVAIAAITGSVLLSSGGVTSVPGMWSIASGLLAFAVTAVGWGLLALPARLRPMAAWLPLAGFLVLVSWAVGATEDPTVPCDVRTPECHAGMVRVAAGMARSWVPALVASALPVVVLLWPGRAGFVGRAGLAVLGVAAIAWGARCVGVWVG